MADFTALKTAIQNAIKQNGNNAITGNLLQDILISMVSTLGDSAINGLSSSLSTETTNRQNADGTLQSAINTINTKLSDGYTYLGIATPTTNPSTTSGKVFYIATTAGTYTNFLNSSSQPLVLTQGINILKYNGTSWSVEQVWGVDDVPTAMSNNLIKSGGVQNELALGAVYDVSAKNPTAGPDNDGKWESLSALLSDANLNTLIPTSVRKGGMSIKYVCSSDNKYVQYRLMTQSFSTTPANWQGVDVEIINGSDNLPKSGAVYIHTKTVIDYIDGNTLGVKELLANADNKAIINNNTWTASNHVCHLIKMPANTKITWIPQPSPSSYTFLSSGEITIGSPVSYAQGYDSIIGVNQETEIISPDVDSFMYVQIGNPSSRNSSPKKLIIHDVGNIISDLTGRISSESTISPAYIESGYAITDTDSVIGRSATSAIKNICWLVVPKAKYIVRTLPPESIYKSVIISDIAGNVIESYIAKKNKDFVVDIPENGYYLYINCQAEAQNLPVLHGIYSYNTISDLYGIQNITTPLLEERSGKAYRDSAGKVIEVSSSSWYGRRVAVKTGEVYTIQSDKYGSSYPQYLITDGGGSVLVSDEPVGVSTNTPTANMITIPTGGVWLYINNHNSSEGATVKEVGKKLPTKKQIKVGCCNCGKFEYPKVGSTGYKDITAEDVLTDDEYRVNWCRVMNDMDYDVLLLSDYKNTFRSISGDTKDILFRGQYYRFMTMGIDYDLVIVSRIPDSLVDVEMVNLPYGESEETVRRHWAYKVHLNIEGKTISLYALQCHPGDDEGAIGIRALQYQALINNVTTEGIPAVLAGDFNSHSSDEYDIFTYADMNIANCGYTGIWYTLRGWASLSHAPADNIITTSDIRIKQFKVYPSANKVDYPTDHYPIMANLEIQI